MVELSPPALQLLNHVPCELFARVKTESSSTQDSAPQLYFPNLQAWSNDGRNTPQFTSFHPVSASKLPHSALRKDYQSAIARYP